MRQEEEVLAELAGLLRVPTAQGGERVSGLLEEVKTLKKQATQRRAEGGARTSADDLLASAQKIGGATVVIDDDVGVLVAPAGVGDGGEDESQGGPVEPGQCLTELHRG